MIIDINKNRSLNKVSKLLDDDLYKIVLENVPIVCVSLVIENNGLLLLKRNENPLKGEWCIPGGRLFRDETIKECAFRKAKEELNLNVKECEIIGIMENFFDINKYESDKGTHVIEIIVECKIENLEEIKVANEFSEYKYTKEIPEQLHGMMKTIMREKYDTSSNA